MQTSNLVYTHPGQPQMQVEVILASASNTGSPPIYTIRMRYPRPIHGEIMTHRVFGRNARSSRAVPVRTMLNEVRRIPYVPWHWGKNQKGMQAAEDCNELLSWPGASAFDKDGVRIRANQLTNEEGWLKARDVSAAVAEAFMEAGYHKQNPNRLLEPFSWIDTLITATQWQNFLWLRDHKDAEPHLQDLARLVKKAIEEAKVQVLQSGGWHLPYITYTDQVKLRDLIQESSIKPLTAKEVYDSMVDLSCKVSAARCARISYKPFDGNASYEKELARYNHLVSDERVHASPLEHQASPDRYDPDYPNVNQWENPSLHGNLTGWLQYRKLIPNEVYHG